MDLKSELDLLKCRVIGCDEARTTTHKEALLILAQAFNRVGTILLCEPSVVGGRSRPPDIAVIDPVSGLHVIEVKGVNIDQVRGVVAGVIEIKYDSGTSRKNPSKQASEAMFDVKDSASRHFNGELNIPFQSWVVFPRIRRTEWEHKFGKSDSGRPNVLFSEDLNSSELVGRLCAAGISRLAKSGLSECPTQQLQSLMAAFGDSEVLRPEPRPGPRPPHGSKGERLDDALAEYRVLTEQQQRLTSQDWNDGPRLVRGVAGSGKTVVLAVQVARMIERLQKETRDLFVENTTILPILVVCFNRTLVPFIRQRIEISYRQRTGEEVPEKSFIVTHFNKLLYDLSGDDSFKYISTEIEPDSERRAARYLSNLENLTDVQKDRSYRLKLVTA